MIYVWLGVRVYRVVVLLFSLCYSRRTVQYSDRWRCVRMSTDILLFFLSRSSNASIHCWQRIINSSCILGNICLHLIVFGCRWADRTSRGRTMMTAQVWCDDYGDYARNVRMSMRIMCVSTMQLFSESKEEVRSRCDAITRLTLFFLLLLLLCDTVKNDFHRRRRISSRWSLGYWWRKENDLHRPRSLLLSVPAHE